MNIKPIGERVLIKPAHEEEKTLGGIYIPDTAKEKKKQGIVLEVGNMKDNKEFPVKKGDTIIYSGYSSDEVEIDGEEYIIINLKDIIAKME
jgi:chaperonin GroES